MRRREKRKYGQLENKGSVSLVDNVANSLPSVLLRIVYGFLLPTLAIRQTGVFATSPSLPSSGLDIRSAQNNLFVLSPATLMVVKFSVDGQFKCCWNLLSTSQDRMYIAVSTAYVMVCYTRVNFIQLFSHDGTRRTQLSVKSPHRMAFIESTQQLVVHQSDSLGIIDVHSDYPVPFHLTDENYPVGSILCVGEEVFWILRVSDQFLYLRSKRARPMTPHRYHKRVEFKDFVFLKAETDTIYAIAVRHDGALVFVTFNKSQRYLPLQNDTIVIERLWPDSCVRACMTLNNDLLVCHEHDIVLYR